MHLDAPDAFYPHPDLHPFRRSSLLNCALQPKIAKNTKSPDLEGSRSFKVIDAKLATNACYDKHHVCSLPIILPDRTVQ